MAHVESRAGHLIEVMRQFVNEMILSNHGAADDYINAAIYDFGMNGEDGFGFICNFVNES